MPESLPAITGNQLIKLLAKGGWQVKRHATHGVSMSKKVGNRNLVTVIPSKDDSLPPGTLSAILGPKQTKLGRKGLSNLIDTYGLK